MSKFGWSYPAGCSGTPYDEPTGCEICEEDTDNCVCPECPVCGDIGNPKCFGKHVGELPQNYEYVVVWDNEHACDELGTFNTRREAEIAGENWLSEMIAVDSNPVEAAEVYSYEIKEREAPPTKEQFEKAFNTDPTK